MKTTLALVALAVAVACGGSAALPPAKLTNAKAEIKAAEAVGAADEPQAALHLKLAQDEVARAERLAKDGDEDKASLVLDNARVDAELALTLARAARARAEATEAARDVEALSEP